MATEDRLHHIEADIASVHGEVEKLQADVAGIKKDVRQLRDMQSVREPEWHSQWPCDTD